MSHLYFPNMYPQLASASNMLITLGEYFVDVFQNWLNRPHQPNIAAYRESFLVDVLSLCSQFKRSGLEMSEFWNAHRSGGK